ncbi:MAG: ABC transporter substrate-binding protein [Bacteroidetes bacterium]|nr:ABC transporter substrate-binding protein [Bacteroidota bacterium]MCL5025437.1 ABC transporter substrate-binding protein [Chloroflexota bacterium]
MSLATALHLLSRVGWPGLLSLTAAMGLLAGCSPSPPSPAWSGLLKIGLVAPFEGQDSARASAFLEGMTVAQNEANERGGVNGRRIELVALDDHNDPATARLRARALIADPLVVAVAGHFTSDSVLAAIEEYRQAGMALLSPATAEELAEPGFYRLGASDVQLVDRALEYAQHSLGAAESLAAIEEDPPLDRRVHDLQKAVERRKMSVEATTFPARTQDFASFARRAREAGPRAVLFWGDAEQAGALIDALPSPKPAVLFIGDGYRLSRLVGPGSVPLFYVTPFDLSQRASPSADFMAKYQGPKEMAGLAAVGYRAARAILDAASAADIDGQHDRAAVQKALDASIGDAGPVSARDFAVHIFHLDGTPYPGRPVE